MVTEATKAKYEAIRRGEYTDYPTVEESTEVVPVEPEYAPRTIRISDIKGFEGEERTDDLVKNIGLDFKEIVQSYGFLAKALTEQPLQTIKAIAANFDDAIIDSYTRWYHAAEQGVLLDAIAQHPLQAIQDLTLPISLLASGGASGLTLAGKSGNIATKAFRTVAKISDIAGVVGDPVSGVAVVGARKIGGRVLEKATGKSFRVKGQLEKVVEDVPDIDVKKAAQKTRGINEGELLQGFIEEGFENAEARAKTVMDKFNSGEMFIVKGLNTEENLFANEIFKADPYTLPRKNRILDNLKVQNLDTPEMISKAEDFITKHFKDMVEKSKDKISIQEIHTAAGRAKFVAEQTGMNEADVLKKLSPEFKETSSAKLAVRAMINDEARKEMLYHASLIKTGQNSDLDILRFNVATDRYASTSSLLLGEASEAGRALRFLREIPKELRLNDKYLTEVIEKTGGRRASTKLANELIETQVKFEEDAAKRAQARIAKKASEATTWDKLMEVWYNGLLSSIQTHAVNMLGNTATTMFTQAENLGAAVISKIPGFGSGKYSFLEAVAEIEGIAKGFIPAVKRGVGAFIAEESPDVMGKMETVHRKAIQHKVLGRIARFSTDLLEGSDVLYINWNTSGKLGGLVEREAQRLVDERLITRGEKAAKKVELMANPIDSMYTEAYREGAYRTFRNEFRDNWLGAMGKWISIGTAKIPLLKLAIPFVRTPTNIANFALERTPLAFTLKDVRKTLLGPRTIERDMAWSRLALGSMVGLTSAWAAANGIITGGAPSDKAERELMEAGGFQEYSMKVKGIHFSYGRIEPLGVLIGVSADMNRLADLMVQGEMDNIGGAIAGSVFKNFSSKTFMRGLNDMVKAINEPDTYAEGWIRNFGASLIPFSSMIAAGARSRDPIFRETENIFERAQARGIALFGDSKDLPPRRNLWGDELKIEEFKFYNADPQDSKKINALINGALRFINPIYMKSDKKDKVTNFMIEMNQFPGLPSRRKGGIELSTKEWSRYIELAGKPAKELLDMRAGTKEWDRVVNGSLEERMQLVEFIDSVIQEYKEDAWWQLLSEFPDISIRMEKARQKEMQKLQRLNR